MTSRLETSCVISMTDEEFRLIRDLITDYCGILFADSFKYLIERRLRPRLPVFGLTSFRDYYRLLKYSPDAPREFDEIVERVTTHETYFCRENYQLKAFTDEIIPQLLKDVVPPRGLRIWSAGCSSGEEPYTIAMLLNDLAAIRGYRYEIFGNDISRKVIRKARQGVFSESAFRQIDPYMVERYFEPCGDGSSKIREEIRNKVTFGHLNLMNDSAMNLFGDVDVIFCRNVIIYFSQESRKRLIAMFHRKLKPGGFLLLGHSESLINTSTDFELVVLENDIVYRKPVD